MKRNGIILVCALAAGLILGLCGFTLSGADGGADVSQDRLIGVFVTRSSLDLFDFEGYFNDNAADILNGGEISEADSARYSRRLYAVLRDGSYKFEGVEGYGYFDAIITDEGGNTCHAASGDGAVTGSVFHITTTDEGEGLELKGTIYTVPAEIIAFYFNPVYQSADGAVYALSGQGLSMGGDNRTGMSLSHRLSESINRTTDGVSKSWNADIELTVELMLTPEKLVLLHMGADGALLQRDEYAPEELPTSLTPAVGAEYIVVETYQTADDGTQSVTRELFGPEDGYLTAFSAREDGICIQKSAAIAW